MNKLLVLLIAFSLLLGVFGFVGVMADSDDQDVSLTIDPVVDISVNNLVYGLITPPSIVFDNSEITVNPPNNVGLTVTVSITAPGAGGIFNDIIFDLTAFALGLPKIGDGPFSIPIADDSGITSIPTSLVIGEGTPAGAKMGTISYIAMSV